MVGEPGGVRAAGSPATLEVAGHRLEYQDLPGDSDLPAVVFLHEGLGSVELWRGFPARVARATGRRVVAYSRYGYGWSDPQLGPRDPAFMDVEGCQVLPALLEQLGMERPVLVGHSDGASIAIVHVGSGAGQAAGLVLIAPHVFMEELNRESIRRAQEAYREGDLARRMNRYHRDAASTFAAWADVWLSADFDGWTIEDRLSGISCPVLLVQGADDPYGSLGQLDAIEKGVSGPVSRLVLAGCGHAPQNERPHETLDAVAGFVRCLPG